MIMVDKNLIKVGAKFRIIEESSIDKVGDTIQILSLNGLCSRYNYVNLRTSYTSSFVADSLFHRFYIQPIESHVDIILW